MTTRTIWGSVNADGSIANGSEDFTVTNVETGVYVIGFRTNFIGLPAVVASQNRFGNVGEANTDGVAVPMVAAGSATAVTGDGGGKKQNRAFGFIAIGHI
jgi:hypothetical protein